MAEYKDLDRKVIKLAKQVVEMCTKAGSGHPSSGLSLLHLTTALMYRVMRYDPKDPWNPASDRLVLSEGHAVPIIYAAYCDLGGVVGSPEDKWELTEADCATLRENESILDGHPNPAIGFPFFDAATGSLGMGLSVSGGLACADKLDGFGRKFYCICGDGESREGQVWEAADFVTDHELHNVRLIFNCNGQGQSDYVSKQQQAETLAKKVEAFGFEPRVIDGHDWDQVFEALGAEPSGKPIAIIARTTKGWGVSALQAYSSHGKPLDEDQLDGAFADLESKARELGVAEMDDVSCIEVTAPEGKSRSLPDGPIQAGPFEDALKAAGMESALEKGKLGTRKAYGAALIGIGADDRVVALDGDVKNSTYAKPFAEKYPQRYFEGRIAEQNMVSAAVGLAAAGRVPFVSSFAKFLVRAYDQVDLAAITNANIKMCGSHSGVSLGADGPSQMGLPDLAFMRSFAHSVRVDGEPAMRVFHPADAVAAFKMTELMANITGMCYMRTHRPDVPFLYDFDEEFTPGGFKHLIDGEDIAIVASGYMVHVALQAASALEYVGIKPSVIDAYSMPLETDEILRIGDDCGGHMLVVEDNYLGGFADELTHAAATNELGVMIHSMYVTTIPKSAKSADEILKALHLTADDVTARAKEICT